MATAKAAPTLFAELRPSLLEVLDVCPVEQCNPADCPLFPLRQMPRRERLRWLHALSEADLQYLATYHRVCMGLKLAAHPPAAKLPAAQTANRAS